MAIFQTGGYQVKPAAVNRVKKAIQEVCPVCPDARTGHADVSRVAGKERSHAFLASFYFCRRGGTSSPRAVLGGKAVRVGVFTGTGRERSCIYRLPAHLRKANSGTVGTMAGAIRVPHGGREMKAIARFRAVRGSGLCRWVACGERWSAPRHDAR